METTKQNNWLLIILALVGLGFGVGLTLQFWPSSATQEPTVHLPNGNEVSSKLSRDFILISQGVLPSVVSISTQSDTSNPLSSSGHSEAQSEGSGVIVDAQKGYILTNNHVIEDSEKISVQTPNGQTLKAKVVGTDPPTDLAVIQINHTQLKAAKLGDSSSLRVGEWVLAIGNPFGLKSSVTAGIISAKGRADVGVADFEDFIQTDAAINPGNSGGALINTQGEVIGINTAIATRSSGYMGIGFAIPINMAKKVMQELIDKGKVTRSQLGIFIGPLDKALLKSLKLPEDTQGILVMDVIKNSPAEAAGFKKYDVITQLNGKPVREVNPFRNQIAMTPPGQAVQIRLLRNQSPLTLKPILKEMPVNGINPLGESQSNVMDKLGFQVEALTDEIKERFDLPRALQGVIVVSVKPDGPAGEDNGLRHGDIITELNRQSVASLSEFYTQLQSVQKGEALLMSIIRDKQSRIVGIKVP